MKRVLSLWSVILAGSLCISFCFYFMVHREAQLPALSYAVENEDRNDIIFIGSSRVRVQIDPAVIDSITGLHSHSLALDGTTMVESHMLLEAYLHHHPFPRLVVLNIDINAFETDQVVYNFPDYFPYLKDSVVYANLAPYSVVYRSRALQGFYAALRLISLTDNVKINLLLRYGTPADESILTTSRGFTPVSREWSPRMDEESRRQYVQHTTVKGFQLLEDFSRVCFRRGIQVLFIYAPEYFRTEETALNYES